MRAIVLRQFGPPDVLREARWPKPSLESSRLLVRVRACGVCGHDVLARRGLLSTRLPIVVGHEIAGDVIAVGAAVRKFQVGDRVALVQRVPCGTCDVCRRGRTNLCVAGAGFYGEDFAGGYAEQAWATELNTAHLPTDVSYEAGAIASCALGTGLRAVARADIQHGDRVLITGATGGVGIHAVQFAAAAGAEVIAVTASPSKSQQLAAAGATVVIDAHTMQSRRDFGRLTGSRAVDAVIELAGPPSFAQTLRLLTHGGRMVVVGNLEPSEVVLPPGLVILKELSILGSSHATLSDLSRTLAAIADHSVRPVIADVLPLEHADQAHARLEDRTVVGRIVLSP